MVSLVQFLARHRAMVQLGREAVGTLESPQPAPRDQRVEVAEAFSRAVLERLPHGIRSSRWEFRVLTPVSSFNSGVTITPGAGNQIEVATDTPLFAIVGQSTRPACQPPADGARLRVAFWSASTGFRSS